MDVQSADYPGNEAADGVKEQSGDNNTYYHVKVGYRRDKTGKNNEYYR